MTLTPRRLIPWHIMSDEFPAVFYPSLSYHCTWTTPQVEGCPSVVHQVPAKMQKTAGTSGPRKRTFHDRRTNVMSHKQIVEAPCNDWLPVGPSISADQRWTAKIWMDWVSNIYAASHRWTGLDRTLPLIIPLWALSPMCHTQRRTIRTP